MDNISYSKANIAVIIIIAIIVGISLFYVFGLWENPMTRLIGLLIAISFFMTLIIKPEIAILFLAFVASILGPIVSNPTTLVEGQWSINLIGVLNILIVLGGIFYLLSRKVNIFEFANSRYFFLFLLVCAITILFTPDKIVGLRLIIKFASFFIIYLLAVAVLNSKKQIIRLIHFIFFSAIMPCLVGFFQLITRKGDYSHEFPNRIFSTFSHPNTYAFYLVMLLPMALAVYLHHKEFSKAKILLGIYCLVLGFSMIITYTRGAWIGFLFALIIIGFRYKKIFIILPFILVLILFLFPEISNRLQDLFDPLDRSTSSFAGRLIIWKETVHLFLNHPFIGHGIGSFPIYAEEILKKEQYAHNDYLRVAIETGIIGLFAYLLLLFNILRNAIITCRKLYDRYIKTLALGLISITIAFIVISLSDNIVDYLAVEQYFWLFVASVEAGKRIDAPF